MQIVKSSLDVEIEKLIVRLGAFPDRSFAAFFACCAERLFPLYEDFCRNVGWNTAPSARVILDKVWEMTGSPANAESKDTVAQVPDRYTPHVDDFDTLEATFAQDAMICLDAAVRALTRVGNYDPRWVEYSLEGIRMAATNQLYGYMDLGSTATQEQLESVASHPWIMKELASQGQDLAEIESLHGYWNEVSVAKMKTRAMANAWTISLLR